MSTLLATVALFALFAAPTDPCGPEAQTRRDQALGSYNARDFLAAARIYEDLWGCSDAPRDLVNAIQSYHLDGRFAESIDLWERALAREAAFDGELRERALRLIEASRPHTVALRIVLSAAGRRAPDTAEVALCRVDEAGEVEPCTIRRRIALLDGDASWSAPIDPGRWQVEVRWASHPTVSRHTLRVGPDPGETRFVWRPARAPRRLPAALLGAGAAGVGGGLALALFSRPRHGDAGLPPVTAAGSAIGGAGLGLVIGGAALALTPTQRRRDVGLGGLSLGVALAGLGVGLMVHAADELEHRPTSISLANEYLFGTLGVGLGAGLTIGGVVGLIQARQASRQRAGYALTPSIGPAGVQVRVDF